MLCTLTVRARLDLSAWLLILSRPPSLILLIDVRPAAGALSFVEALVGRRLRRLVLDWGVPEPEDRYLDWEAVLAASVRRPPRPARDGASSIAALGYCMGGTLTTIDAAQHAEELAALVTLAAPIYFSRGGMLRCIVDPSWFDADAVADAGNVTPAQMQAGFAALRPTLELGKLERCRSS